MHFWVGGLMVALINRFPRLLRRIEPFVCSAAWHTSRGMRRNLLRNARWLLGRDSTPAERRAHGRRVVRNFYRFICELGEVSQMSDEDLGRLIAGVEGRDRYDRARAMKRGAILLTAHLGSFEKGIASIRTLEPHVHVVFRRDPMPRFERLRAKQRARLRVTEAPVDDGLHAWMNLRDALQRDEVVLMQGDLVMPDQRGQCVAFCGGHTMFPTGPAKLAMATGAPIIPVFAVREAQGRVRIHLEEAIQPPSGSHGPDAVHTILQQIAGVMERYIMRYPDQWLRVHTAFCEDLNEAAGTGCGSSGECGNASILDA